MKQRRWLLAAIAAAGCADSSGAMGQTAIGTECARGDEACLAAGIDAPLAVGATLDLHVDATLLGAGTPTFDVVVVDPAVVGVEGRRLTGVADGLSALLFDASGTVIDFFHLYVATADSLSLERVDDGLEIRPGARVQLLVGDELPIATTLRRGPEPLIGYAATEWLAEGAVELLDEGIDGRRRLVARAPGSTPVTVRSLGLETTFTVEVLP